MSNKKKNKARKTAPEDEHYTFHITAPYRGENNYETEWQPTKITPREGWAEITPFMRLCYIAMVVFTLGFNYYTFFMNGGVGEEITLLTWFGSSSMTIPTVLYVLASIFLLLYFIYRDLIRRSLSHYRLFMPFVATLTNVIFVSEFQII